MASFGDEKLPVDLGDYPGGAQVFEVDGAKVRRDASIGDAFLPQHAGRQPGPRLLDVRLSVLHD